MNSYTWILISEFIFLRIHTWTQNLCIWIHIHEFIYSWIHIFLVIAQCTYEFICIWIHIIISHMNSYNNSMNSYMNSYMNLYDFFIYEFILNSYMNLYDFFIYEFMCFINLHDSEFGCTKVPDDWPRIPLFYPRGSAAPLRGISPIATLERFVVYCSLEPII